MNRRHAWLSLPWRLSLYALLLLSIGNSHNLRNSADATVVIAQLPNTTGWTTIQSNEYIGGYSSDAGNSNAGTCPACDNGDDIDIECADDGGCEVDMNGSGQYMLYGVNITSTNGEYDSFVVELELLSRWYGASTYVGIADANGTVVRQKKQQLVQSASMIDADYKTVRYNFKNVEYINTLFHLRVDDASGWSKIRRMRFWAYKNRILQFDGTELTIEPWNITNFEEPSDLYGERGQNIYRNSDPECETYMPFSTRVFNDGGTDYCVGVGSNRDQAYITVDINSTYQGYIKVLTRGASQFGDFVGLGVGGSGVLYNGKQEGTEMNLYNNNLGSLLQQATIMYIPSGLFELQFYHSGTGYWRWHKISQETTTVPIPLGTWGAVGAHAGFIERAGSYEGIVGCQRDSDFWIALNERDGGYCGWVGITAGEAVQMPFYVNGTGHAKFNFTLRMASGANSGSIKLKTNASESYSADIPIALNGWSQFDEYTYEATGIHSGDQNIAVAYVSSSFDFSRIMIQNVPFDECANGSHTCDPFATCSDDEVGFTCTCNAGYTGDGFSCTNEQGTVTVLAINYTQASDANPGSNYHDPGNEVCGDRGDGMDIKYNEHGDGSCDVELSTTDWVEYNLTFADARRRIISIVAYTTWSETAFLQEQAITVTAENGTVIFTGPKYTDVGIFDGAGWTDTRVGEYRFSVDNWPGGTSVLRISSAGQHYRIRQFKIITRDYKLITISNFTAVTAYVSDAYDWALEYTNLDYPIFDNPCDHGMGLIETNEKTDSASGKLACTAAMTRGSLYYRLYSEVPAVVSVAVKATNKWSNSEPVVKINGETIDAQYVQNIDDSDFTRMNTQALTMVEIPAGYSTFILGDGAWWMNSIIFYGHAAYKVANVLAGEFVRAEYYFQSFDSYFVQQGDLGACNTDPYAATDFLIDGSLCRTGYVNNNDRQKFRIYIRGSRYLKAKFTLSASSPFSGAYYQFNLVHSLGSEAITSNNLPDVNSYSIQSNATFTTEPILPADAFVEVETVPLGSGKDYYGFYVENVLFDECTQGTHNCAHTGSTCLDLDEGFTCGCNATAGWTGSDTKCYLETPTGDSLDVELDTLATSNGGVLPISASAGNLTIVFKPSSGVLTNVSLDSPLSIESPTSCAFSSSQILTLDFSQMPHMHASHLTHFIGVTGGFDTVKVQGITSMTMSKFMTFPSSTSACPSVTSIEFQSTTAHSTAASPIDLGDASRLIITSANITNAGFE